MKIKLVMPCKKKKPSTFHLNIFFCLSFSSIPPNLSPPVPTEQVKFISTAFIKDAYIDNICK